MRNVRDSIAEEARIWSVINNAYSSAGLVGGFLTIAGIITAPFTFGVSLGLTITGLTTAGGVITNINTSRTRMMIGLGIVEKKLSNAKEIIQKHYESCKEMKKLLEAINNHYAVFKVSQCVQKKNIKLSVEGLSALAAVKIITETDLLIKNSGDGGFFKISNARLCEQRDKLTNVIYKMQDEYNDLSEFFSLRLLFC